MSIHVLKWATTMINTDLSLMSIDELWALHEAVADILAAKMLAEKKALEARLVQLQNGSVRPVTPQPERRPYPEVRPKFRNPQVPSETWSGRGRMPRWMSELLRSGKRIEEFLIIAEGA